MANCLYKHEWYKPFFSKRVNLNKTPEVLDDYYFMKDHQESYFEYEGIIHIIYSHNNSGYIKVSIDVEMSEDRISTISDYNAHECLLSETVAHAIYHNEKYLDPNATIDLYCRGKFICCSIIYPGSAQTGAILLAIEDGEILDNNDPSINRGEIIFKSEEYDKHHGTIIDLNKEPERLNDYQFIVDHENDYFSYQGNIHVIYAKEIRPGCMTVSVDVPTSDGRTIRLTDYETSREDWDEELYHSMRMKSMTDRTSDGEVQSEYRGKIICTKIHYPGAPESNVKILMIKNAVLI